MNMNMLNIGDIIESYNMIYFCVFIVVFAMVNGDEYMLRTSL